MRKIVFLEKFKLHDFSKSIDIVNAKSKKDVEITLTRLIHSEKLDFSDFISLISPSADFYLEEMASFSKEITEERFGKTILMYMPMYLSNECRSSCLYCGFSFENKIRRKTLSFEEIRLEAEIISQKGIRHILILTGEDYSKTPISYLISSVKILKEYFHSVSIEVYPMDTEDYAQLIDAGVDGLALYQETYDSETYKKYHLRGVKKDMNYRLNGPDRGGIAGFRKIGIGALLGLSNPIGEMYFLGLHATYLLKEYWRTSLQVSLPRMRPTVSDFHQVIPVSDREFLRFIFAIRLYFKDAGIVLSTRENEKLRNNLLGLGITSMSAESKTEPGGYSGSGALEQFETEDKRNVQDVMRYIREKGYDPVLKDFDSSIV
ncbi:MAG: 2-iminoacetate synthase ThiH [Leptospiraceae bacterium]|nr:2-iminoacetate synthase ThiH [Leptospiraceae bacterium]